MSESTAVRSRWRRPLTWVLLAIGLLVAWLLVSLALTAWHAKQANTALADMKAQIAAGDTAAAQVSIDSARDDTAAMQSAITSLPISALRIVPYVNTNLTGAEEFMNAAQEVLDAADVTNQLYARMAGTNGGGPAVFENGTISISALQEIQPQIDEVSTILDQADAYLQEVPSDVSPMLRGYVDEAAEQVAGIQKGLRIYDVLLPDLPTLLGQDEPARYLVVFHNPGELYPGGGASLNAAVIEFDKGELEVVDKGAVSSHFFPGNPSVPWNPTADGPYYAEEGATDGFAWSNLHQDFRVAGEDMMRSWVANGGAPVDGVISLDPAALQAAVAATGPIESELYGEITADNLVSKLFYEGYNEDPAAQEERHKINQQLIDEMLTRMQDGNTALTIGRAIFSTAPGQHIRIRLSDGRIEKALREAEADGAQPDPEPDRIAFYTQNQNASKVDIFQQREVVHDVYLEDNGGATVVQTAKVTNNAPAEGGSPLRIGYTTRWAFHWNLVFLPEDAEDVKLVANPGEIKKDKRVFTDVDGRKVVRIGRWIPPGESSYITVSYRLPDGTFGTAGNLEYRASVEHQLTINDVDLTVNVYGPSEPQPLEGDWTVDGDTATTRFPVTRPTVLAVGFGDRG
ncbi:MAG: DUF4012 domain-containing protein [Actinobacteria bacterium]|nr:DUF4012 domain-containing protein [Actinomycetota bacterium]MCB9414051.1 DUF4012 domain-containing protein [Actinomycetota bacterium]MCB9424560.1 DUF4012 domain-containing protein [Actinomycetota bacterium]HRY08595.1 DUF4012 domain-containing protein [Candidatus Nanopelagicales bacterium]